MILRLPSGTNGSFAANCLTLEALTSKEVTALKSQMLEQCPWAANHSDNLL
jgi:hypothetical protein